MVRAKRETLIVLPVVVGLVFELLSGSVVRAEHWRAAFALDSQFRSALFALSFALFWLAVPRSKRLMAFMFVLFGAMALNVAMLSAEVGSAHYVWLKSIRYDESFGFSKVYRVVEVLIVCAWAAGIKENVYYLCCRARHYGRCVGGFIKRTLRWT